MNSYWLALLSMISALVDTKQSVLPSTGLIKTIRDALLEVQGGIPQFKIGRGQYTIIDLNPFIDGDFIDSIAHSIRSKRKEDTYDAMATFFPEEVESGNLNHGPNFWKQIADQQQRFLGSLRYVCNFRY